MHNSNLRKKKVNVAALSVLSNTLLVIGKLIAGLLSGSVSIISEAIHSGLDLIAAIIAFFAVRAADKPADTEHPFGHGKIENFSATIEAILIFVAAIWIIYEALEKIVHPQSINNLSSGIIIMGISAIVNTVVSRILMKVAKETDSLALEADALHLSTDVWTSVGIFLALIIIKFTNFNLLDPIAAILVALLIIKEAYSLTKKAINGLLDSSLSNKELQIIGGIINNFKPQIINYHDLRARQAGSERQIDMHVMVQNDLTIAQAHKICDDIEEEIKKIYPTSNVIIHVEPN